MRLFIAIDFDRNIKNRLLALQERIRRHGGLGNFSRYENLHLTLEFLGEVDVDDSIRLIALMDSLSCEPFCLTFNTLGRFSRNGRDIWWVGTEENPTLVALQKTLRAQLRASGFRVDSRRFQPHLTLARDIRLPEMEARTLLGPSFVPFSPHVSQIQLKESTRENGRLVYLTLHTRMLE